MKDEKLLEKDAGLDELTALTEEIDRIVPQNAVISLKGDLASGKTTLVQYIAGHRGADAATSPTFSLQHSYGNDLFHYDLYRVDYEEMANLGLLEEFDRAGWHLVEWMDEKLKSFLAAAGYNLFEIEIEPISDRRKYTIRLLNA